LKPSRKSKRGVAAASPHISVTPSAPQAGRWLAAVPAWVWVFLSSYLCAYAVYLPALNGEFVFDDLHGLFLDRNALTLPLPVWWNVRPLLMTTYWANVHLSPGNSPFSYHVVNVFFHGTAAIFLFFVLRRFYDLAVGSDSSGTRDILAAFGTAIFLLHPIQTEAVAYIAQRGESMGAMFYFTALCVFLYRRSQPVSWRVTAAIVCLYGAAVTAKEHTVTLVAIILLADYFFNPGFNFEGIKRNWRLYSAFGLCAAVGLIFVAKLLKMDTTSVGFHLESFTAAQYLYTEFRVFFVYLGLFIYPLTQSIDYDFEISKSLFDHGSIVALGAILLLSGAAVFFRRKFPLAAFGFLSFVLMLLPTSSVVPILDTVADRRMYLPMFGLILIVMEAARHLRISRLALVAAATAVCIPLAIGAYKRNEKWSSAIALWADAAEKAPNKSRVQFGLADSELLAGRCHDAVEHLRKAIALSKPDFQLYMNLGMAYNCDRQYVEAERSLRKSIELKPSAQAWASLAIVVAQQGEVDAPFQYLSRAEQLDPSFPMTFIYRGEIFQATHRNEEAVGQFRHALVLDPTNTAAKAALQMLRP